MLFRPQGESFVDLLIDQIDQVEEGVLAAFETTKR